MKNTLHSPLFCLFNFHLEFNKKLLFILLFGAFLFTSNLAHAQLPLFDDFESGFGNWNDGGGDADRVSGTLLNGIRMVRTRDNSGVASSIFSDEIDLTSYSSVTISFLFYANGMENNEDFFVEYFDGTNYVTIANYIRGTHFNNGVAYSDSITITSGAYTFATTSRFRIRCDASNNNDVIYLDDINITGVLAPPCTEPSNQPTNLTSNSITETSMNISFTPATSSPDGYLVLYNTTGTTPTITDGTTYTIGSTFSGNTVLSNNSGTTFSLTGLTDNTTYYFYVFSMNSNCSGGPDYLITSPLIDDRTTVESCSPSTSPGTSDLGCPFVELGGVGLDSSISPTVNCSIGEVTLEANYLELGDTSSYTVESIPYNPPFQYGCLANPVSVNLDDVFSPVINLPFDFCFYGNTYNSCVIGSNGVISFDTGLANGPSGWRTVNNIPSATNAESPNTYFGPSIFGVHHDVDPSVGGEIGYQLITLDTGCRALVAAWKDVPMYWDNSILYTGMMVIYEDTNVIEVYVDEKNIDGYNNATPWNDGRASIALQEDSSSGIAAPGRNTRSTAWSTTQEAWRFVPSGAPITDLKWYEGSISAANEIIDPDDDNQITVTPTSGTTTYIAEVTYSLCNGSTIVETNTSDVIIVGNKTWNGSQSAAWGNPNNWTPIGVPVPADCILIPITGNDPIMSGTTDGVGYNLEIMDGATLTQQSNSSLTIEDVITIEPTGDLEIRDSASLIQITDVVTNQNTGNARLQREVPNTVGYFDYVYWSSPVDVFDIEDISPGTPSFAMYKWSPTVTNGTAGLHGTWVNTQEDMEVGKGYIVRGLLGGSIANTVEFQGTLNNGQISYPISRGSYNGADYMGIGNTATADDDNWNLLGNPYPSAISLTDFVTANPAIDGTLYFWRHLTPISNAIPDPFHENYVYNYSSSDYLAENSSGSVPAGFDDDLIASGQGFFALMLHSASTPNTVTFSNSMRDAAYDNTEFYRSASSSTSQEGSIEKHRIWLDLVDNNTNTANSILVGYIEGATDDIDRLYDGRLLRGSGHKFYSIASDQDLVINGKGLPFNNTDIIPLGYQTLSAGDYTITINSLDGLFNDTVQNIYLEDTELNIIHDLRANPYNFTSNEGIYNDRFVIKFTPQLLNVNDDDIISNLEINAINRRINVSSKLSIIKTFELFDLTGRTIHKNLKVDDTSYEYQNNNLSAGAYIVQVSLANGYVVSKKVVI